MKRIKPHEQRTIPEVKVLLKDVDAEIARLNDILVHRSAIVKGLPKRGVTITDEVFVSEGTYELKISGRWLKPGKDANKPVTYRLPIADKEIKPEYNPITASKMMHKYVSNWSEAIDNLDRIYIFSSRACLKCNGKVGEVYHHCYSYDINKCYLWVMSAFKMPDTRKIYKRIAPQAGQLGFIFKGDYIMNESYMELRPVMDLLIGFNGCSLECDFVCDTMESPFRDYADYMVAEINKATEMAKSDNPKKREKAIERKAKLKYIVNVSIGLLQDVNPFMRAAIVGYANLNILHLVKDDETVLYYNTDSIASTRPRTDLDIGDKVGQWKIENEDEDVTFYGKSGLDYEWSSGKSAHRGRADDSKKKYTFNADTKQIEIYRRLNDGNIKTDDNAEFNYDFS